MKREVGDYIEDIISATGKVMDFVKNISYEEFIQDDKTVFAVVRALEIIGEAAKNIPDDIRKNYPEIPWKDMAGMRDKVIHEYFGVKLSIVWRAVKEEIPPLKPIFEKLEKKIEFSDLIKKFPIFEKFSYDELHYICNLFKYVEIQVVGKKIISISTPDSLAQQLNSLMIALDYPLGYKYDFIAQKLKLKNDKAAHRLVAYIIEQDLNSISIIEKEEEVLRGKSPSKKYVDLKVLINTGNIDMDEFILSQLKGKIETLELSDNRKEDFMKVLNFLVNKMIYGRNHRDFIQDQAEK